MRRTGLTQPQRSVIIGLYQVPMWPGKCFGWNAPAKSGVLAADDRGGSSTASTKRPAALTRPLVQRLQTGPELAQPDVGAPSTKDQARDTGKETRTINLRIGGARLGVVLI